MAEEGKEGEQEVQELRTWHSEGVGLYQTCYIGSEAKYWYGHHSYHLRYI